MDLAVALALALSARASAAEEADPVERARTLARAFELDAAIAALDPVIESESTPAPRRIAALELRGVIQIDLGQEPPARESFEALLRIDPGHELDDPSYSPRVREFFEEVRASIAPGAGPGVEPGVVARVEVGVEESVTDGGVVVLSVTTSGEGASAAEVAVLYRAGEAGSWRPAAVAPTDRGAVATIVPPEGSAAVAYYVEARAPNGFVLGRLGSEEEPRSVELEAGPAPPPPPSGESRWYTSWWFWTIIGVVVAGGTTAAVVATTVPGEEERGSLGVVHLP